MPNPTMTQCFFPDDADIDDAGINDVDASAYPPVAVGAMMLGLYGDVRKSWWQEVQI